MTDTAPAVVTETAPVTEKPYDGPVRISTRKGKKGPGTFQAVAATPADAVIITADLAKELGADVTIITAPYEPEPVLTATAWQERQAKMKRIADLRAELKAAKNG